jgi:hypothetical protein
MKAGYRALLLSACIVSLSGCSWLSDWSPKQRKSEFNASAPPPGQDVRVVQTPGGTWLDSKKEEQISGQQRVYSTNDTPDLPVPGMAPIAEQSLVMNQGEVDVEQRIAKLEKAVTDIHSTMEKMLPALTKLASIESDLQRTLSMVQPAAGPVPTVPDRQPAALYETAAPVNQAPSGRAQPVPVSLPNYQGYVQRLRVGEHSSKTRIVLDTSDKIDFNYHVNNQTLEMIVNMPRGGWSTQGFIDVERSPLISNISARDNNAGGTEVVVKLKKPVSILWAENLVPGGSNGHRVVIDISSM